MGAAAVAPQSVELIVYGLRFGSGFLNMMANVGSDMLVLLFASSCSEPRESLSGAVLTTQR